jgi:transglutaminase-like putative cysteine protease
MDQMILNLIRHLRPRIGWAQTLLAFGVALCPASAASDSTLRLPADIFFWAGLLGLLLGLRMGRPRTENREPRTENREPRTENREPTNDRRVAAQYAIRNTRYALRFTLYAAIILGFGALLVVAAGEALPPFGLIAQDAAAFAGWALAALRREVGLEALPTNRTGELLAVSLPRLWGQLLIAPSDGERGARLLVAVGGVAATWIGALTLGWALTRRRPVLGWGIPLLVALGATTILGGGSGTTLLIGLPLLLLLAVVATFRRRELAWDRSGTDYSEELGRDVLFWGGPLVVAILLVALALPTSLSNPLTDLLWRDVELPSGIAVLERNMQRPAQPKNADVGLSTLPALQLGLSLEQPPPEKIVLRVRTKTPLPPGPWPHYWRARVFNLYDGRSWSTNARVSPFEEVVPIESAPPDTIVQEVEDLRSDHQLLLGLPDILSVSIGANVERLPDGALAALTEQGEAARYVVVSRPQELAAPPPFDRAPPDMSIYLGLPKNMDPRIGDTARVVVGTGKPPYEQALAIERFLRALPYSYQVQPLPGDGEAVKQFLFDMRQGYCTYYASAMAVLARSLGIPARVVVGYVTGEYDQTSGAYLVREADAHAWPELFIGGRWTPFEPTPIRPLPARTGPPVEPAPDEATAPEEQPASAGPLIWAGVLAAVALLSFLGVWLGRPGRARPLVAQVQLRLERLGARAGFPWPRGATLHEYGALLEPHTGEAADALHEVIDLVEVERYGGRALRLEEQGRLRAAADMLWSRLSRTRRQ